MTSAARALRAKLRGRVQAIGQVTRSREAYQRAVRGGRRVRMPAGAGSRCGGGWMLREPAGASSIP